MPPKSSSSKAKKPASKKVSPPDGTYTPPTKGVLSKLPASWVPYAELVRLEQPHGNYMIYFPHLLGLIYASSISPVAVPASTLAHRAGIFAIWTFLMRGAGCAWNDNTDREFDRRTARCRNRPIARGAVSPTQGHIFTLVLTLLAFWAIQSLPSECTYVGLGTTVLAAIYPFGKRFTNFPQVILGSTLASTIALSSYSVGLPALSLAYVGPTLCLTATIVLLVIFYDTVYARQDTADDLKSGVKGMAVYFRNHLGALLAVLTTSIAGVLFTLGQLVAMGPYFFTLSVAGVFTALVLMIAVVHWGLIPQWTGHSGWFYALAISNLLGGFILEYTTKTARV
ncbi:Prenytransferase ascA [Cladobotryum mycophilum]|uniref:Prenytransferase ascA n=1 Tax=Cladobotryum mycophilum TaxID=491253 RepID=A0ABR0SH99_9HYPO